MLDWFRTQLGLSMLVMMTGIGVLMGAAAYCIYFERKVSAWLQDRHGPNRVGPLGLFQSIADGLKLLLKEDIIPAHVDRFIFILAPTLAFVLSLLGFAIIPWGGHLLTAAGNTLAVQVASIDVGLLYLIAVGSVSVYGVVLGAWASNNKYSFYGGMRASAQMLSYEIPLGLAILVVVMISGEFRLERIVEDQIARGVWNVAWHPLACLILIITAFAETNRAPFDLAECEQEIVGGYHTEYSALKFGMFFLGEYVHMMTNSALIIALFFGGYHLPFVPWTRPEDVSLVGVFAKVTVYFLKVAAFIFLYMWVRWTIPRFRFDQLMRLAWKGLIPVASLVVVLAAALVYFGRPLSWWAPLGNVLILIIALRVKASRTSVVTGRQEDLPDTAPAAPTPGGWS